MFGEDPRRGYVRGSTFIDPEARVLIEFPEGWEIRSRPESVLAVSDDNSVITLGVASSLTPEQALADFFASPSVREPPTAPNRSAGPYLPHYFQARVGTGTVGGLVSFVRLDKRTFQLVAYSDVGRFTGREALFRETFSSFGPVADPALLDVAVKRIAVASVPGDMTLNEFQRRFPSVVSTEELAALNRTAPELTLVPGQLVKRVIAVKETPPIVPASESAL